MTIVLASRSPARAAMLAAAAVEVVIEASGVDEAAAKAALLASGAASRTVADRLAELKALRVAGRHPEAIVLGCDQVLELDDGRMLDKPGSLEALGGQLRQLSGHRHRLVSACVAVEDGRPVWRAVEVASLTMHQLSDAEVRTYVAAEGMAVLECVGGYRIEGRGIQLFQRIEGSHFAILGLPLLPLLNWLRSRGLAR